MSFQTQLSVRFDPTGNGATLLEDLVWLGAELVSVPSEFKTDFFSTPGWVILPALVPHIGPGRSASVLHDWLYRGGEQGNFTRKEADQIFLRAMESEGVCAWRRYLAYAAVRIAGAVGWHG